jgi:hypothetical protein
MRLSSMRSDALASNFAAPLPNIHTHHTVSTQTHSAHFVTAVIIPHVAVPVYLYRTSGDQKKLEMSALKFTIASDDEISEEELSEQDNDSEDEDFSFEYDDGRVSAESTDGV